MNKEIVDEKLGEHLKMLRLNKENPKLTFKAKGQKNTISGKGAD